MATAIHQEVTFPASPDAVYKALVEDMAGVTGAPAEVSAEAGGAFSCFDGQITGRNVELASGRRIVQAWRVAMWPEGVYSLVRMELSAEGEGTRLTLDHTGIAEDQAEHLDQGWHARYWEPLAAYLG